MKMDNLGIEQIKNGYTTDAESYICIHCNERFDMHEVFKREERFYDAKKAVELHIDTKHTDRLSLIINSGEKQLSLTDNQKVLFDLFYNGLNDSEIAQKMGTSISTVRHQRFVFRERAKAAKIYLAVWELVEINNSKNKQAALLPVHEGATMVDARYIITEKEEKKILENVFTSLDPLKLKIFSAKEKKKIVILRQVVKQFERENRYTEKEVNEILKAIYEDYATLRRYLIEYGHMDRTKDCKEYWVK